MLCTDNCRKKNKYVRISISSVSTGSYHLWNGSDVKISLNVYGKVTPSSVGKSMINLSSGKNLAYQGFLIYSKQGMNWDVNDF